MIIGINASSALKENPTGVEEYTFQLIKHLAMISESRVHRFVLYLNPQLKSARLKEFEALPDNFEIKFLFFPAFFSRARFLWTQVRLAWEMKSAKIDILFIPIHVLPIIHPKKTVVAVHGLEYELFPELYSFFTRHYTRFVTQYALKNSTKIIAVSKNTKQDLVKIYGANPDKISVVYHGGGHFLSLRATGGSAAIPSLPQKSRDCFVASAPRNDKATRFATEKNYILYIGRIELKKNILGIIKAYNKFRIRNSESQIKLVLIGGGGYGYEKIASAIDASSFKNDIVLKGYVPEEEKNELLKNSAIFLFPSFYEGFGLPVLEAQKAGVPIIASATSCLPEIAGEGAVFIDPKNSMEITEALENMIARQDLRQNLIQAGYENVKRFSWEKCARETLDVLTKCV